jgi:ATP-dependent Clp protease protease subunit
MVEIYAHHTGRDEAQIGEDMERDRFFTAEQAVEYGLVDSVLESRAAVNGNGNGAAPAR